MIYPAIGMMSALWLIVASLLGIESGIRLELGIWIGAFCVPMSFLRFWLPGSGKVLAGIGIAVGLLNLGLPADTPAMVNFTVAAIGLVVAGVAPGPVTTPESDANPAYGPPRPANPVNRDHGTRESAFPVRAPAH